jgi:hypothetical protein
MKFILLTVVAITLSVSLHAQQGIQGTVVWGAGNQMPGPDRKPDQPKGIAREIHIYEATTMNQAAIEEGVFFSNVATRLVKKTKSKKNGNFCVKLPPGEYSVFIKEPKGLFANSFDGRGRIQCVTVKEKAFTTINIQVNYEAAY